MLIELRDILNNVGPGVGTRTSAGGNEKFEQSWYAVVLARAVNFLATANPHGQSSEAQPTIG